jgi:O-antigen/teichoic acid export membrane protein
MADSSVDPPGPNDPDDADAHVAEASTDVEADMKKRLADPELQKEWRRQNDLIYSALIAVGVVMVQPFLAGPELDLSATICVVSFAVALPVLSALVLVTHHESFRQRASRSRLVEVGRNAGQLAAVVGVGAGFWHISWIAGVAMIVATCFGMAVHSAGFSRLELGTANGD